MKQILAIALVLFWVISCNETGVSDVDGSSASNLTVSSSGVLFSQLANSRTLVKIPFSAFGADETAFLEARVQTLVNGTSIKRFSGEQLNYIPMGYVWFYVDGVNSGDTVDVFITRANGSTMAYTGTASASADVSASVSTDTSGTSSGSSSTPTSTTTVTFGKIDSNAYSMVTIPLAVVGDAADDVDGVTVDVTIGATMITSNLSVADYYDSDEQEIKFYLTSVMNGDTVSITLHLEDGSSVAIDATLSDSDNTEVSVATADADATAEEATGTPAIYSQIDSNGYSMVRLKLAIFGSAASDVSGATVDVTVGSRSIGTGLSADDYYDSASAEVQFYLTSINDGETITITVHLADGSSLTYSGAVSASADTEVDGE